MEFKLQMIISNHGQSQQAIDLTPLSRTTNNMIDLGLSLADSKLHFKIDTGNHGQ